MLLIYSYKLLLFCYKMTKCSWSVYIFSSLKFYRFTRSKGPFFHYSQITQTNFIRLLRVNRNFYGFAPRKTRPPVNVCVYVHYSIQMRLKEKTSKPFKQTNKIIQKFQSPPRLRHRTDSWHSRKKKFHNFFTNSQWLERFANLHMCHIVLCILRIHNNEWRLRGDVVVCRLGRWSWLCFFFHTSRPLFIVFVLS